MSLVKIKKGLNLPITGEPKQVIEEGQKITKVALLGEDYIGMKPTMIAQVGDVVKTGDVLFTDKKLPKVKFTSPGSGKVLEINRGEKRAFKSIVIALEGDAQNEFKSYNEGELGSLGFDKTSELLLDSGLWTSLKTKPFSAVADPDTKPHSIFVNMMDTNPLAPAISEILKGKEKAFENGVKVLSNLTDGRVFVCKDPELNYSSNGIEKVSIEEFSGPHPSGNSGTHIHFIDPASRTKTVWYIGLQDVIAIGHLFVTGKLLLERIVALGGPGVKNPRLLKTRVGANLYQLTKNELKTGGIRIISGSVLFGRQASEMEGYLGKFHQSVSVLAEVKERKFLGWLTPGSDQFSVTRAYISSLTGNKKFPLTTDAHGQERAIVPIGSYEKVMPLDILPTFLLRSIAVDDLETAEQLGCLELDEEDLALCTVVCPSKIDHGVNLRRNLTLIQKEG